MVKCGVCFVFSLRNTSYITSNKNIFYIKVAFERKLPGNMEGVLASTSLHYAMTALSLTQSTVALIYPESIQRLMRQ